MVDSDVSSLRNRCVARLQQLRKMRWVLAMNLIFSVRDLLNKSRGWLLLYLLAWNQSQMLHMLKGITLFHLI